MIVCPSLVCGYSLIQSIHMHARDSLWFFNCVVLRLRRLLF